MKPPYVIIRGEPGECRGTPTGDAGPCGNNRWAHVRVCRACYVGFLGPCLVEKGLTLCTKNR